MFWSEAFVFTPCLRVKIIFLLIICKQNKWDCMPYSLKCLFSPWMIIIKIIIFTSITTHYIVMFIMQVWHFVYCHFKCSNFLMSGGILIGCQWFMLLISWKKRSDSDSNNTIPFCHESYSCVIVIVIVLGVNSFHSLWTCVGQSAFKHLIIFLICFDLNILILYNIYNVM